MNVIKSLNQNLDEFINILGKDPLALTSFWRHSPNDAPLLIIWKGIRLLIYRTFLVDGLCIYVRDNLRVNVLHLEIDTSNAILLNLKRGHTRYISRTLDSRYVSITKVNYQFTKRSPKSARILFVILDAYVKHNLQGSQSTFFLGDINNDLFGNIPLSNEYLRALDLNGLKLFINKQTRELRIQCLA